MLGFVSEMVFNLFCLFSQEKSVSQNFTRLPFSNRENCLFLVTSLKNFCSIFEVLFFKKYFLDFPELRLGRVAK